MPSHSCIRYCDYVTNHRYLLFIKNMIDYSHTTDINKKLGSKIVFVFNDKLTLTMSLNTFFSWIESHNISLLLSSFFAPAPPSQLWSYQQSQSKISSYYCLSLWMYYAYVVSTLEKQARITMQESLVYPCVWYICGFEFELRAVPAD